MASRRKRMYWDACSWIAYIQQEKPGPNSTFTENRYEMCSSILRLAVAGKLEIATSCFTLAEVCKKPDIKTLPTGDLARFFDHSYILQVSVDKNVGVRAQNLQMSGLSGLKPPDAVHLASAVVARAEEFHTFDEKLLKLNETFDGLDGTPMKIVRPGEGGAPLPLIDEAKPEEPNDADADTE